MSNGSSDMAIEGHANGPTGITLVENPPPYQYEDYYAKEQKLRSGSYGTVYTCHHKDDPLTTYAVKIMDRSKLKKKDDDAVFREVSVLRKCSELENVVRVIDFFVEPSFLYLVQVFAAGGDVFDRLAGRQTYTEADARNLSYLLLKTISDLHDINIVHRDLKPENLLLKTKLDDSAILVADFGFARQLESSDQKLQTRCGTPAYVSPEILVGSPYGKTTDLWSIGCIVYMLIAGYPPFQGDNHRVLFRKIRGADFCFHDSYWKNVTIESKQLIARLLTVNPEKRWTPQQALESPWFTTVTSTQLKSNDLSVTITEIKKFSPKAAWKRAFNALGFASTARFWKPDAISFGQQLKEWDEQIQSKAGNPLLAAANAAAATAATDRGIAGSNVFKRVGGASQFKELYTLVNKIRKGSFATVWECRHKLSGEMFACKVVDRSGLKPADDEAVLNEVGIMQSLHDNKYSVQLLDFYEEDDFFYMVMEYMTGGDVFDRIVQFTQYTEKDAHDLAVHLLKALRSIHEQGIAHRDIKPQNLLLVQTDDNAKIKIGDFGFAKRVHTLESLTTRVGTPTYVAPEILKNIPHDHRVDLWSVGVVIFVLLVGYPPFMEDNQNTLFLKIRNGDWVFLPEDWKNISDDAKDLIKGLLVADPNERWTIEEALRSSWITRQGKGANFDLASVDLSESLKTLRLKKNKLRSLARAYMGISSRLKATSLDSTRSLDNDSDFVAKKGPNDGINEKTIDFDKSNDDEYQSIAE
jgi:serine/threonine protein kinase